MLLNKEELRKTLDETLRKRIPSEYRLKYGPESDLQHFVADEILTAERAKAAPHCDALPMMDSRELFMAGAEWGKAQAEKASVDNIVVGSPRIGKTTEPRFNSGVHRVMDMEQGYVHADLSMFQGANIVTNRRAELLELAGRLAAESRVSWLENVGKRSPLAGMRTQEQLDADLQSAREYHAKDTALMAAAILDAVDKEVAK